jgi:hypothetical protein
MGQHSNADSSFLHYASPALRAEAMEETTNIVNEFSDVTFSLIEARRLKAKELAQKYAQAQLALQISQASEANIQRQLDDAMKEIAILRGEHPAISIDCV